jgi:hypothetical protein
VDPRVGRAVVVAGFERSVTFGEDFIQPPYIL